MIHYLTIKIDGDLLQRQYEEFVHHCVGSHELDQEVCDGILNMMEAMLNDIDEMEGIHD